LPLANLGSKAKPGIPPSPVFYAFCSVVCSIKFSSFGRIQFIALAPEGKNANPNLTAGSLKSRIAKHKKIMSN